MSQSDGDPGHTHRDYDVADVVAHLDRLEDSVTEEHHQRELQRSIRMLESIPGRDHIHKYTSRDIGEAFVGGILFSLPLLVEDGVFAIAEWFTERTVAGIPVYLGVHVTSIFLLTAGLLYAIDLREVRITNPIFGLVPRRLVGVLVASFLVSAAAMLLWGRLHAGDPTSGEQFARISVIWAAAALGAVLADILPGESAGEDISDLIGEEGRDGTDLVDEEG